MKKVKLFTADGGFVADVKIPPFLPGKDPDVIMWGQRFFKRHSEVRSPDGDYLDYRECFVYAVPPELSTG